MKKIFFCIPVILFSLLINPSMGQEKVTGTPSSRWTGFEEIIAKSTLIVEGEVICSEGFEYNGNIYTSCLVKITKLFKGNLTDSIIEVITDGGVYGNLATLVHHGLHISKGEDGILALADNVTNMTMQAGFKSFRPSCFIAYHSRFTRVANHYATYDGITFDNLEQDLYRRIEAATKIPRKVYGPNILELEAEGKLKNR